MSDSSREKVYVSVSRNDICDSSMWDKRETGGIFAPGEIKRSIAYPIYQLYSKFGKEQLGDVERVCLQSNIMWYSHVKYQEKKIAIHSVHWISQHIQHFEENNWILVENICVILLRILTWRAPLKTAKASWFLLINVTIIEKIGQMSEVF